MALLIFPLGLLLGFVIRSPRLAAGATAVIGVGALVALLVLAGSGASPLEALVLAVGTPVSSALAFRVALRRAKGPR